jgi:hypothetical protein
MLAISTLRQAAPSGLDAALGQELEAVYERSFRLGRGFVVGVGNGLILGWLMYRSELVPRGLAIFGLIGDPLIIIAGVLVMFDVIEGGGPVQRRQGVEAFVPGPQGSGVPSPRRLHNPLDPRAGSGAHVVVRSSPKGRRAGSRQRRGPDAGNPEDRAVSDHGPFLTCG